MNDKDFEGFLTSIREAAATVRGEREPARVHEVHVPNPRAIRERMRLNRYEFSLLLGVSERTLENWEQGRRHPHGPARQLLIVAERHPEALLDASESISASS
jgi:putative transcriptional regulator